MKRRDLTQEKICIAAIKIIEAEGLENLTMRHLAKALNIEAASLYNHITNKNALFDAIQEYLYAQIPPVTVTNTWREHLLELAITVRQGLLQIPNVVVLFATRPTVTKSSLQQANLTVEVLINSGFEPADVMVIYRNLHVFVLGHVLAEVGRTPGETEVHPEPSLAIESLNEYPALKKALVYKDSHDFMQGFKFGLNNFLDGLEVLRGAK
jgi:TetR/AcrR family tetracycline transcriptional repressor